MDNWIEWAGGDWPAPRAALVEVRLRDGTVDKAKVRDFSWDHCGVGGDIVAYRVVEAAKEPAPNAAGWVEWAGGECPVPAKARVEVQLRGAVVPTRGYAKDICWGQEGKPWDVIAYRVVEVAKEPAPNAAGFSERRYTVKGGAVEPVALPELHVLAPDRELPTEPPVTVTQHQFHNQPSTGFSITEGPTDDPLARQEGGSHYKDMAIQPVEFIHANGIGYFEGNVIKYVARWRKKNGVADLEKARHYIDLLIRLEGKA